VKATTSERLSARKAVPILLAAAVALAAAPEPRPTQTTTTVTTTTGSTGAVTTTTTTVAAAPAIRHVFVILMENHDWSEIYGNKRDAPFINGLLSDPEVAWASNYVGVTHPSEPNYLVLEAGDTFGVRNDRDPEDNSQTTHDHLAWLLDHARPPRVWRSYQEHIELHPCPISNHGLYAVRHNPVMYFTDVTHDRKYCADHVKPLAQMFEDLKSEKSSPAYAFITPDLYHDMHNQRAAGPWTWKSRIREGDDWLKETLPVIRRSDAYRSGVVMITWDESEGRGSPAIGMLMISPHAAHGEVRKRYDHYDLFRTIEAVLGVGPVGNARARRATVMNEFFKVPVPAAHGEPSAAANPGLKSEAPDPKQVRSNVGNETGRNGRSANETIR